MKQTVPGAHGSGDRGGELLGPQPGTCKLHVPPHSASESPMLATRAKWRRAAPRTPPRRSLRPSCSCGFRARAVQTIHRASRASGSLAGSRGSARPPPCLPPRLRRRHPLPAVKGRALPARSYWRRSRTCRSCCSRGACQRSQIRRRRPRGGALARRHRASRPRGGAARRASGHATRARRTGAPEPDRSATLADPANAQRRRCARGGRRLDSGCDSDSSADRGSQRV